MAFPGDQRHSGGPAPQDEAPFGANNPYSFPPTGDGSGEESFDGTPAEPPSFGDPVPNGFGRPGPFAEPGDSFGQPPASGSRSLSRGTPPEGWFSAPEQGEQNPYGDFGGPGQAEYGDFGGQGQTGQAGTDPGWPNAGYGPAEVQENENPYGGFNQPGGDQQETAGFGRPGAFAQGGFGGPGGFEEQRSYGRPDDGRPAGKPKSKLPLVAAAVVGAVVVVGGGIFAVTALTGGSGKPTASKSQSAPVATSAAPTASPSPAPAASGALGAKLKTQATDPQPLTIGEIFKNAEFKGYKMTATNLSANCGKQAHGAKLAAALKSGKCTQFLRATYATTDGKLIGTVGVANLSTAGAAKKAQKAAATTGNWMVPLAGTGITKKISGKASSLGSAEARGHYLILTWVQRPDGKVIGSALKSAATAFATKVPLGSNLNAALQYRGISGKPYGA
jgi:hypothetical protein